MNALYESCHGYDEPTASNSTFGHPFASDASFTYNNNLYFNAEIDAMSLYPPITPSAHGARNQYMAMPNGSLITPQSQRVAQIGAYQYDSYNMSLQSSPVYDEPPSSVMPEEPAAPFHMLAYDGSNHSFSDDSNIYGADSTPTPKMRGMPMPAHQMASSLLPFSYDGRLIPTIELSMLQYKNFGEAEAEASGRTFLDIEEDDWHVLESNKEVHVAAIMAAFDAPFKPEPNVPLTATEKLRWVKYQTEQCEKVSNYLAKNETAKEASAWMLLEALLDIHKFGYKKGFRVADPDRCCSRRFAQMVWAIRNYAVIRFDLVRMLRFDDLATSPAHFVARKVANWRGNAGKVKRDELNKEVAARAGVEYTNVLGAKRIFRANLAALEEGNEDTSGMKTPPLDKSFAKRKRGSNSVDKDSETTPTKGGRKTAAAATPVNKRAKRSMVVAGPDADI